MRIKQLTGQAGKNPIHLTWQSRGKKSPWMFPWPVSRQRLRSHSETANHLSLRFPTSGLRLQLGISGIYRYYPSIGCSSLPKIWLQKSEYILHEGFVLFDFQPKVYPWFCSSKWGLRLMCWCILCSGNWGKMIFLPTIPDGTAGLIL